MTNNTTTVRVLENNLKPATHFIEVWSDGDKTSQEYKWQVIMPIKDLYDEIEDTEFISNIYTIAIFKIRMKPQ